MKHGRIIRVTPRGGRNRSYATYVVAEESAAKAVSILTSNSEPGSRVETIGRASLQLLRSLSLSPGEFKEATDRS